MTARVTPVGATLTDQGVRLDWSDGASALLPPIWLRDNCRCERCGDTSGGRRFMSLSQLDRYLEAAEASLDDDGVLGVAWADGHMSRYGPAWLVRHGRQAAPWKPRLWDAAAPPDLDRLDSVSARDGGAGSLAMLRLLLNQGMVVVRDVGPEPGDTEAVMNVLGPIQIGSYGGRFFEIENHGDTVTLSNSHHDLAPHTDEPFRYAPPGIIAFHAIRPAAQGGDSILIDGFRLAEEVRRRDPEAFGLLSTVPQAFERRFDGHFDLVCHARAIVLDGHGAVCGFRFAERSTSPPRVPEGEVDAFYHARRVVTDLIADPAYRIVLGLDAGDMLLFDNHRLMHGRTGVTGARHLRQCNVTREDAHSAFRMIARRLGESDADIDLPMGALA